MMKRFENIFLYIKMLTGYYQKTNQHKTKKDFQKVLVKGIKIYLKQEKIKSNKIAVNNIETFLKMKSKWLVEYRKNHSKMKKLKTG